MQSAISSRIKIAASLAVSLIISYLLIDSLFVEKSFIPRWEALDTKVAKFKDTIAQKGVQLASIFIAKNVEKIIPTQPPGPTVIPTSLSPTMQASFPTQTAVNPTAFIPTPTFSLYPTPTAIPTLKPVPTGTPIPIPTKKPDAPKHTPTSIPKMPTATPKPATPTNPPGVPTFSNPLAQQWYGNGSGYCYSQNRFIQVYANGVTPDSCRSNVKNTVSAQTTTVSLLGRTITVHKKAYPAYKAVSDRLEQYKKDATHYDFPGKKNYEIRNVGAYVFRCNVNASTSGKFDTCSSGCVLSPHAFGIAVDINYDTNANGSNSYDMPDEIINTFEYYGFRWGGRYPLLGSRIDAMHFEYMVQLCDGV